MPKPRRESTARADTRPAFNRPPGARVAPVPTPQDEPRTPKRTPKEKAKSSPAPSPSPEKKPRRASDRHRSANGVNHMPKKERDRGRDRAKYSSGTSTNSASQLLSSDALAKLNAYNDRADLQGKNEERKRKQKQYKNLKGAEVSHRRTRKKNRNVSGAILEEGRAGEKHKRAYRRGGGGGRGVYEKDHDIHKRLGERRDGKSRKKLWWLLILIVVLLAIFIPVGVVVSNNSKSSSGGSSSPSSGSSTTDDSSSDFSNQCDSSSVPESAKGTYTDISTWLDTTDFNCTYTAETVGGLSVMGLYSSWDDSTKANDNVPALDEKWEYGKMPIRGVNIGGWLSLEPFITPSMFDYPASDNVVDEWTLTQKLGSSAQRVLETHYAAFITKQSFIDIRNAGLDHVRIPFPYWAVTTYEGDPYVPKVAWRYLLRAIEYCRENGLRVNLDLHSVPGSQNGWAHSGRQGDIGWILGANGATNAQRSLDIHDQLSQFFAQARYKNVVTIYGLVNEPKMLVIPHQSVLDWNKQAISIIRGHGIDQQIVFGDGFLSLDSWDDMFHGVDDKLVMDTHQYQIFNTGQLKLKHQDKINLACSGWTGLMVAANNPETGWGPTLDGEWSQADTDCTPNLNNVGAGSRWAGTLDTGNPGTSVLTPTCAEPPCSCAQANADPSQYTDAYKQFLQMYAEAQMHSFEQAWGWFYWTWKTESATQWSWMLGLKAGILPEKAYSPSFKCDSDVPDFSDLPDSY
ncbi:uncharacterized protein Z518_03753 [Rhinocladiella mackenziei CBS 650.93]|uniref:glucan 1,3-beta-glucosidase n=1 Tax=Rhinocladiella mackenziei CBS 650.93 TaxID=1442369 RepID=A0A0D2IRJ2_9EURO|nr:uncharacterized protein Z518_03753 [Rhinocladiella mackenziei CBS 650.93]KIX05781.1 hypothetical protein Z518_03753 [Rhinocladiella mackenziei CBS 650.93]